MIMVRTPSLTADASSLGTGMPCLARLASTRFSVLNRSVAYLNIRVEPIGKMDSFDTGEWSDPDWFGGYHVGDAEFRQQGATQLGSPETVHHAHDRTATFSPSRIRPNGWLLCWRRTGRYHSGRFDRTGPVFLVGRRRALRVSTLARRLSPADAGPCVRWP